MSKASVVVLLLLCQVFACGAVLAATEGNEDQAATTDRRITVQLAATSFNPGKSGKAIIVPVGKKTAMTVQVSGVPDYTALPIHLYVKLFKGSCANRNPKPMFVQTRPGLAQSLVNPSAIAAYLGPAQISQNLPFSIRKLQKTPFAISVYLGPSDGGYEIFCGDTANGD